jgi:cullin 2
MFKNLIENSDEKLLQLYHQYWLEFSRGSEYLNNLFIYLNTQYVKKNVCNEAELTFGANVDSTEHIMDIGEMALDCWRKFMIEPLKEKLIKLILDGIDRDRKGESVNQSVIHGVINSLVDVADKRQKTLGLYETLFEKVFIEQTGEYYKKEASRLLEENNCSSYMEKALARLNDENLRSRRFLNPSSYTKVNTECQKRLVEDYLSFLHSECKELIKNEVKHDLRNMYKLLKPFPNGLTVMVEEVQNHIARIGLEAVNGLKGDNIPTFFVEQMLQIHSKYSELIKDIFQSDQEFLSALDKACSTAINHRVNTKVPCRSPELLAKYCDSLLRKSSKEFTENEIDDKLLSCITIFKYLDDKDYFHKFFHKMLSRRLIGFLSFSMYAEENMINRLRHACGYEFTNKFHRMFTDMNVSEDLNEKFSASCREENNQLGVEFSILILQAGAWPIAQSNLPTFSLPQELEKSVRIFEAFYNKSYSGRKLTWMYNYCHADVRPRYLKRSYSINMSTFQMSILLGFNSSASLSIKDLQQTTQLPEKELIKQVQSLLESKLLIIQENKLKEETTPNEVSSLESTSTANSLPLTRSDEINENTIITLNLEYSNKRTKFKILSAVQKETPQETEMTQASVDEDRKLYLQATIVRIMKSRKNLNHNSLIQEVINQSKQRFNPAINLIKKCIELLIDKQYIERTAKTKDEYSYIA